MHNPDSLHAWKPEPGELRPYFDRTTFERGQALMAGGQVLGIEPRDDGQAGIMADVQGSAARPYRVNITVVASSRGPLPRMFCTCPVAFACKHCAATALTWAQTPADNNGLSLAAMGWLKRLRQAHAERSGAGAKTAKPAKAPKDRLFYTLRHAAQQGSAIEIEISKGQPGPDGMPIGRPSPWRNVEQALRRPFAFVNPDDLNALRLLWLYVGAAEGSRQWYEDSWTLPARGGESLLQALAATGRLGLVCDDGVTRPATLRSEPLPATLAWNTTPKGQRAALRLADNGDGSPQASHIFMIERPWFADARMDRVELGPLAVEGLDATTLALLLEAPALGAQDAVLVAQALGELMPAVARPQLETEAQSVALRLQPTLLLNTWSGAQGLLAVRGHRDYPTLQAHQHPSLSAARLQWVYAPDDAAAEDIGPCRFEAQPPRLAGDNWTFPSEPSAHFFATREGQLRRLERDADAERAALQYLIDSGLQPIGRSALLFATPLNHDAWGLAHEADWPAYFSRTLPALRAQGWKVFIDRSFVHRVYQVDAWHADVQASADDAAPGWLVSLGIEVGGRRLDLAPLLADLLRRDPRWTDRVFLQATPDDAKLHLIAPDDSRIEVEAGRVKPLLVHLIDLFDGADDGALRVSRWDALRLHDAIDPSRWQFKGDDALIALAERLRAAGGVKRVKPPRGLGLTLRSYQQEGLAWLQYLREHELSGILADDMGLGKTAQALAHVLLEKQAGRLDRPALVVLPTSLVFNWQAEAARVTPKLRVLNLHGADRAERFEQIGQHDLVLTTYPLLWRDIEALAQHEYHLLILDEAQMVKNAASKSAEAVRQLRARHRLCLTGTPLENHLGELWTQFDFLMPGFLGSSRTFARQWRTPVEKHGQALRAELLARRVRPFILRRKKDDVAQDLPAKSTIVRRVALQGQQRALYESVRLAVDAELSRAIAERGLARSQIAVLDALLKLRQVCCDPRLVKRVKVAKSCERAKLELLADMLPELIAEGRRVLLFSQFTEMLELIEAELPRWGIPWIKLTGQSKDRGALVKRFQAGEAPLFLISLKAGGVGLNLTAADTVIHFDPWWNPAAENQATDRAHRIGQDKPVFVYKLVAEGSIEERILGLQEKKADLAASVLGADGAGAVKFGADDIAGLLAPLA